MDTTTRPNLSIEFHGEVKQFTRVLAVLELLGDGANPTHAGSRVVTQGDLIALRVWDPHCRCTERGLRLGMSIKEVNHLGGGCKSGSGFQAGYVCRALDRLRRRMGH